MFCISLTSSSLSALLLWSASSLLSSTISCFCSRTTSSYLSSRSPSLCCSLLKPSFSWAKRLDCEWMTPVSRCSSCALSAMFALCSTSRRSRSSPFSRSLLFVLLQSASNSSVLRRSRSFSASISSVTRVMPLSPRRSVTTRARLRTRAARLAYIRVTQLCR